ncbi:MAG: hypothetical protein H6834_09335 [Planctomycetes bacterium]|nr:hypothetical protein [Planctomycetota bacterium]
MPRATLLLTAIAASFLCAPQATAQSRPPWLKQAMGYALPLASHRNAADGRAPLAYHPLALEFVSFPGHAERLADLLAQKSRRFGAGIVRISLPLAHVLPTKDGLEALAFHQRILEAFARQGLAIVLQIDGPPASMVPLAPESLASTLVLQSTDIDPTRVLNGTDLAVWDAVHRRILLPIQRLDSPFKPIGECRIVLSGRNEPHGRYLPAGHPLSIGLTGAFGEWQRMTNRLRFLDRLDGRRDLVIGSLETLGRLDAAPADAYTIHDHVGSPFPPDDRIHVHTEVTGWVAHANADASLNAFAFRRGNDRTPYVAHLVEALDLGGHTDGGHPPGRPGTFRRHAGPLTRDDLDRDSWDDPGDVGPSSRIEDLAASHPWLGARASEFLVRDEHALVITHRAVPFYLPGKHPDSGTAATGGFGFELPAPRSSQMVYVRNVGREPLEVEMRATTHNFAALTFQPERFALDVEEARAVEVRFDASNATREGFHAACVCAQAISTDEEVKDEIPIVVLSDVERDPACNQPLIARGELTLRPEESTNDLRGVTRGSQVAVYRVAPGRAFAPSHLRFHFGGRGTRNYDAIVTVTAWDELRGRWDEGTALAFRIDGNAQSADASHLTFDGDPQGLFWTRLDWPAPFWSNPLLRRTLDMDGHGLLTGIRVEVHSLDAADHDETFARQRGFEVFGRVFPLQNSVHVANAARLDASLLSDPDRTRRPNEEALELRGHGLLRTTFLGDRYRAASVSCTIELGGADWAALRILQERPDDLPHGANASGYTLRLRRTPSGEPELAFFRADEPPRRLWSEVLEHAKTAAGRLGVTWRVDEQSARTTMRIMCDDQLVVELTDHHPMAPEAGYVGFAAQASGSLPARVRFHAPCIDPAPHAKLHLTREEGFLIPSSSLHLDLLDLDDHGHLALDLQAPPDREGCALLYRLAMGGAPERTVEGALPWWDLTGIVVHDPRRGTIGFVLDDTWLRTLFEISAETPVQLGIRGRDRAGNVTKRWMTIESLDDEQPVH